MRKILILLSFPAKPVRPERHSFGLVEGAKAYRSYNGTTQKSGKKSGSFLKSFSLLFILIFSVGCCRDEVIAEHMLTEEEKSLIPYEESHTLTYRDSYGSDFSAFVGEKETIIITERTGPESCNSITFESLESKFYLQVFDYDFRIIVQESFFETTTFEIKWYMEELDVYKTFSLNCAGDSVLDENLFKDISLNEFHFQDVLVLKPCLQSHINKIVYSAENGIEYIEFNDGRFVKLVI